MSDNVVIWIETFNTPEIYFVYIRPAKYSAEADGVINVTWNVRMSK